MRVNVGCGPHYAKDWINTDVIYAPDAKITPDVVVKPEDPFPFDEPAERIYCGHVVEHMPWADLPRFLGACRDALAPDGELCIVGPDSRRVLERWKLGLEDWGKVAAILEGPGAYLMHLGEFAPLRWDADRHHWNCDEQRVLAALRAEGWTAEAVPVGRDGRLSSGHLAGWPVVDFSPCQFAVLARP